MRKPRDRSPIAETRIHEAIAHDHLDDLSGRGKRLDLEDLSRMPQDLRAGYLLLNAVVLP